ncbi:MAG: efflux RND transporter periplasmic adaptor subunit, partial [Bacteroidota bacterium]
GSIKLHGKITFNEEKTVKIYPLIGAGRVVDVRAELGSKIEQGQVIAVIKSAEAANLRKDYAEKISILQITKKNFLATQELHQAGLASKKELENIQEEYALAKFNVKKAEELLHIYSVNEQDEYLVKAPISGYIVEKNTSAGTEIRSDFNDELFIIADLSEVWNLVNIYENDIKKITENAISWTQTPAYPEETFVSTIDKIAQNIDPESHVVKARIRLSNPELLLKPEMLTSNQVFFEENKKLLRVSQDALIFDHNQYFVVVRKGDLFVLQSVELYQRDKTFAYLSSGLSVGDVVLCNNVLLVYNFLANATKP